MLSKFWLQLIALGSLLVGVISWDRHRMNVVKRTAKQERELDELEKENEALKRLSDARNDLNVSEWLRDSSRDT